MLQIIGWVASELSDSLDGACVPRTLAPAIPELAYLAGGAAIAVHLGHRVSHNREFFHHRNAVDRDQLNRAIATAGPLTITTWRPGALNAPLPN